MCSNAEKTKQGESSQERGMPDNFAMMFNMMEQYCKGTGCSSRWGRMMKDMGRSCCGFADGGAVKNSDGEEKE